MMLGFPSFSTKAQRREIIGPLREKKGWMFYFSGLNLYFMARSLLLSRLSNRPGQSSIQLLTCFCNKYRLPYTLQSDEGNKVRKDWEVSLDLFGTLLRREICVIDNNGVVQLIYNNQFQPEKHIDETLKVLQSL
ncbi:hypothetical protein RGQ29_006909 [Quercus rubra]|uniref:Alkyl hydroperoxide reductase subunit C/ Thiol specific antioxidant domain-containing protein n=1 Tax=Quercus rubra TaxID=3512 RepID=A0AAN7E901_QUERU|nr:hypothetical protein RGQ29_006909 [Quercus rubra]